MRQPTLKPLPVPARAGWFSGTRAWLIGLGLVAVLLAGLIGLIVMVQTYVFPQMVP